MPTLTRSERAALRRGLIKAGIATRGRSTEDLIVLADQHGIDFRGAPERTPKRKPRLPRDPEIQPMPEPEHTPEHDEIEPDPTPTPAPAPAPVSPTPSPLGAVFDTAIAEIVRREIDARPAIDEDAIAALVREHSTRTLRVEIVPQDDAPPRVIDNVHEAFPRVLRAVRAGVLPMLFGPMGSGKTTIAANVADALDVPFYSTGAVFQKYELTGYKDANGNFHDTALLYEAVQRPCVYLWDEIDGSMAPPLVAFNQMLGNRRMTFPTGEIVDVHPECRFIAAANTRGTGPNRKYVGRNALDGATLDRFYPIEIGYDAALETAVAHAEHASAGGDDRAAVDRWIDRVRAVRQHVTANEWPIDVSPRASYKGARMLAWGESVDVLADALLYGNLSADQRRQIGV